MNRGRPGQMTGGPHQGGGGGCNRRRAGGELGCASQPAQGRGEGGRPRARPGRGGGGKQAAVGLKGERERFSFSIFFLFTYYPFSYLVLTSTPRILFTNYSTTSKKIMVRHDATTKENISRVYSHKVSS
jgi:hypothetical protein